LRAEIDANSASFVRVDTRVTLASQCFIVRRAGKIAEFCTQLLGPPPIVQNVTLVIAKTWRPASEKVPVQKSLERENGAVFGARVRRCDQKRGTIS
jgi:hypothetical protein